MIRTAACLLAFLIFPSIIQASDKHPCIATTTEELDEVRALLGKEPWKSWLNKLKSEADEAPNTPRMAGLDVDLDDWESVYHSDRGYPSAPLSNDTNDLVNNAFAYQLSGQTKYRDTAINIINAIVGAIDTSNPGQVSNNKWYYSITIDIIGVAMITSVDLLWEDMSSTERGDFTSWFQGVADAVVILHEVGRNNGSNYKKRMSNIKHWDNALLAYYAALVEDEALAYYVAESSANAYGSTEFNLMNGIQVGIMEVWSGQHAKYGNFMAPDVDRHSPISVSYWSYARQAQMHAAQVFRTKSKLDFFRHEGRKNNPSGDMRHNLMMDITHNLKYSNMEVPAADNQYRTWDSNNSVWYYSCSDIYLTDGYEGNLKLMHYLNAMRSDKLQNQWDYVKDVLANGLGGSCGPRMEVHILKYGWPFLMASVENRGLRTLGDMSGNIDLELGGHAGATVAMEIPDDFGGSNLLPAVPVDTDDGYFHVGDLPPGTYDVKLSAPGHRNQVVPVNVTAGGQAAMGTVELQEGKCEITPKRGYFTRRSDFNEIKFRYENPDGTGRIVDVQIDVTMPDGSSMNLWPTYPHIFRVSWNGTWFEMRLNVAGFEDQYQGFSFEVDQKDRSSGIIDTSKDIVNYPLQ